MLATDRMKILQGYVQLPVPGFAGSQQQSAHLGATPGNGSKPFHHFKKQLVHKVVMDGNHYRMTLGAPTIAFACVWGVVQIGTIHEQKI